MPITVYARREPTQDATSLMLGLGHPNKPADPSLSDQEMLKRGLFGKLDVVVYRDEAMTEPFARFTWDRADKPRPGQKMVTLNCYRWTLQWMPDFLPRSWDAQNGRVPANVPVTAAKYQGVRV